MKSKSGFLALVLLLLLPTPTALGSRTIVIQDAADPGPNDEVLSPQDRAEIEKVLNGFKGLNGVRFEVKSKVFKSDRIASDVLQAGDDKTSVPLFIEQMNEMLEHPSPKIQEVGLRLYAYVTGDSHASQALKFARSTRGPSLILKIAKRPESPVSLRDIAIGALGDLGDSSAVGFLDSFVNSSANDEARNSAARSFSKLAQEAQIPAMVSMLKRNLGERERAELVRRIGVVGDQKDAPAVLGILKSKESPRVLARAVAAYGGLLKGDAFPLLLEMVQKEKNQVVRAEAAFQLGKYGGKEAVDPLVDILRSGDSTETDGALRGLVLADKLLAHEIFGKIFSGEFSGKGVDKAKLKTAAARALSPFVGTDVAKDPFYALLLLKTYVKETNNELRTDIMRDLLDYPNLGPETSSLLAEQYLKVKGDDPAEKWDLGRLMMRSSDRQGVISALLKPAAEIPINHQSEYQKYGYTSEQIHLVSKVLKLLSEFDFSHEDLAKSDPVILDLADCVINHFGVDDNAIGRLVAKAMGPSTQAKLLERLTGKANPGALAVIAFRHRPELFPEILPKILENVRDPESGRPRMGIFPLIEEIRGTLSPADKERLDAKLDEKLPLPSVSADVCDTVCSLADRVSEWAPKEAYSIHFKDEASQSGNWILSQFMDDGALRALGMLFLVKAAPYCASAEKATRSWARTMSDSGFKLGPTQETVLKRNERRSPEEIEQMRKVVEEMDVPAETLQKVNEFIAASQDSGPSQLNTSIYSKVFFASALTELFAQRWTDEEGARKLLQENDKFLNSSLRQFDKAEVSAEAFGIGSNFNSYALAVSVLASSNGPENGLERMRAIVESEGDPRAIPYSPTAPSKDGGEQRKKTNGPPDPDEPRFRAGAARSVPFQLALYLGAKTANEKKERQDDMILVLRNYLRHSRTLRHHALRDARDAVPPNYQHTVPDWIAPYYYYPSVPYATAATSVLLSRGDLDPDERKELEGMQAKLKSDLFSMLKKDGLFQPEYPGILGHGEKGGITYANPLAGLALLPLVTSCRGLMVPKSNGILRSMLRPGDSGVSSKIAPLRHR